MAAGGLAGSLWIQMGMDLARLSDDMAKSKGIIGGAMRDMNSAISTVKSALGALGIGFGVGYFVSFLKGTNDAVAHMKELGQEAGVSAEAISRFEAPARSAGLGLDSVATAIFRMGKASLEARDPASKSALALNAIGLSTQQLKDLKPDEMFELVARSISKYGDGLAKNNVMQELFGKSGREMNRVVAEVAENGKLAATVTEEQVVAAKKLNDQILELKMNSEKSWRSIVAEGVPALNAILKAFLDARKEGSLLDGVIAGVSMAFDKMAGDSLEGRLVAVNARIKDIQATTATWKTSGQIEEAKNLNNLLAMRKILEGEIFDRAFAAQKKAQEEAAGGMKPKLDFDPARAAFNATIPQRQALALMEFNEQIAKDNAAMWDDAGKDILKNDEIITKARMELAAMYAKALRDDTLGEEENLATRVKLVQDAWALGTQKTFADYIFHARNAAEQANFLFTNAFRNMEDGLVEFVRTGKLDFRSFADSVIADLIRIQIRQMLAGFAGSSVGIAAGLGGLLGLGGASDPSIFAGHTGGIVGLDIMQTSLPMHPALLSAVPRFHSGLAPDERLGIFQTGERIIPRGGGGGEPVFHQVFNIGSNVTKADLAAVADAGRRGAMAAIAEERRRDPAGPFGG